MGPESSGKTESGMLLADRMNYLFVPEFARSWLMQFGPSYQEEDLDIIAQGQADLLEEAMKGKADGIIVDSGILSVYMWALIKYRRVSGVIDSLNRKDPTSRYFLFRPTLPWTPDPLRENPYILDRAWIYNRYINELVIREKEFHFTDPMLIL